MHAAIFKERTQPPTCYLTSGFHSVLYLNGTFPPSRCWLQANRALTERGGRPFRAECIKHDDGWMHVKFRFFFWRIELLILRYERAVIDRRRIFKNFVCQLELDAMMIRARCVIFLNE